MKGSSPLFSNFSSGGSGGNYSEYSSSPLGGNSQPYQKEYSVYAKMMKKDIKLGVYDLKTGYIKNPTARTLDSMFDGKYVGGPHEQMTIPYVITTKGEVIVGKRNGFGRGPGALPTPHPTLIGGLDPKVRMAGMLTIKDGKILSYNNTSGHYRPNIKSIKWADEAFKKYPKHIDFRGEK
jgi:hypothetical protein